MIGDPDPYTAIMNALQYFRVDDIVISTLPETKSGWLRADLIERVRNATGKDVEHVVAHDPTAPHSGSQPERGGLMEAASIAHAEHHHGPPAGAPAPRGWRRRRWGCCFSSSPR